MLKIVVYGFSIKIPLLKKLCCMYLFYLNDPYIFYVTTCFIFSILNESYLHLNIVFLSSSYLILISNIYCIIIL